MKDQNSRNPIYLRGIDRRNISDLDDTGLLELINMRFTGKSLQVVTDKTLLTTPYPQYKILYKHVISTTKYAYWGIYNNAGTYFIAYTIYENDILVHQDLAFKQITVESEVITASRTETLSPRDITDAVLEALFEVTAGRIVRSDPPLEDEYIDMFITCHNLSSSTESGDLYYKSTWEDDTTIHEGYAGLTSYAADETREEQIEGEIYFTGHTSVKLYYKFKTSYAYTFLGEYTIP